MQENTKKHLSHNHLFLLLVMVLCVAGLVIVATSWIGFRNYIDGVFAIRGALLWLDEFPYLGTTHWELRHPFVLSVASSILIFGKNELSILAPNIVAYLAIIIITMSLFHKYGHTALGFLASLVFLSVPVFSFSATTIFPGMIEFLFVLSSVVLFFLSISREKPGWAPFFLAGLLGGLAFTTRETSIALAICYFVLFVGRFGGKRSVYFIVAAGFVLPVVADFTYVYLQSGDPLYRLKVDIQQYHPWKEMKSIDYIDPVLPEQLNAAEYIERANNKTKQKLGHAGPVDINKHLNPFVAFFTNHEYQAIFFIVVPAILYLLLVPPKEAWLRRLLLIFYVLAICWFITTIYIIGVRSLPRYMLPVTYTVVIITATAIYDLIRRKKYFIAYPIIISLSGISILSYDLHSERLHEERLLAEIVETHNEPVYAPPSLVQAVKFFIQTRSLSGLVDDAPPPSSTLYLYSKKYLENMPDHIRLLYEPEKSWEELETYEPRTRLLGSILEMLGLLEVVPFSIREKIYKPGSIVTLYRVSR